jgi:hypothetical protein
MIARNAMANYENPQIPGLQAPVNRRFIVDQGGCIDYMTTALTKRDN